MFFRNGKVKRLETHREYSNLKEILLILEMQGYSNDLLDIFDMKNTLLWLDSIIEDMVIKQVEYKKRKRN